MPQTHIATLSLRTRSGALSRVRAVLMTALIRHRERQRLAHLDAHLLRDIGLDPQEVRRECTKPFWQP